MGAESIFIIIGFSFALLLLIKMLSNANYKHLYQLTTIIMVAIICIEIFYGWLYFSKQILQWPHLIRLNTPIVFVIGPVIYFFTKSRANPQLSTQSLHLLHLIPFFLVILYFIPVYLYSPSEKIVYIQDLYISLSKDSIFIGGLRRIHQGIYLLVSLSFFILNKKQFRFHRTQFITASVLALFGLILVLDLYRYFFQFDLMSGLLDTLLLCLIAVILVYNHLSLPRKMATKLQTLDTSLIQDSEQKIIAYLENEKAYLDPKLNLQSLSKSIKLSPHLVSLTINKRMNQNFNVLINSYRVEEAKRLLKNPDMSHLTIEAIAELAGFNSISSFNNNFKKLSGKAPKEFRK